jgi:hypothetical protein
MKTWEGKDKFVYEIIKRSGQIFYKCVSTSKHQHLVVEQLVDMCKGIKNDRFRILCNGSIVCKVNYYDAKKRKMIYDQDDCVYYLNLDEMSKELGLTEQRCYGLLKSGIRYVFVGNE